MLSIMNEINPCLLLLLCVLYEIQNQINQHNVQILVIKNKGRSKTRNSKGCGKSRSQLELKGKFKCFYCDKQGRIRRNYKAWKNKQKDEKNQNKAEE